MHPLWLIIPVFVVLSIVLPAFVGGAWSPTRRRAVHKMLRLADTQPGDVVIDLGAGDGRIILAATNDFGATAIGIEIDPLRWLLCQMRIKLRTRQGPAHVKMGNFFDIDLSDADVVTFYLSQAAADKLQPKLEKELKSGSRVVSYRRPISGWKTSRHDTEDDIYIYVMGKTS